MANQTEEVLKGGAFLVEDIEAEKMFTPEDYTEEQAASHGIKIYGEVDLVFNDLHEWTGEVFGKNVLTAEEILGE